MKTTTPFALLIAFAKAWTKAEGKKDLEILRASTNPVPRWPWSTTEEFHARLQEATGTRTNQHVRAT